MSIAASASIEWRLASISSSPFPSWFNINVSHEGRDAEATQKLLVDDRLFS